MSDNPAHNVVVSDRFNVRVEWSDLAQRWRITGGGTEGIWDGWRGWPGQDDADAGFVMLTPSLKEKDGFRWWAVVVSRDSNEEDVRLEIVPEDPAHEIHQLTVQAAGPVWMAEFRSKGGPALLRFGSRVIGRVHPERVILYRGTSMIDGPGWTQYRP